METPGLTLLPIRVVPYLDTPCFFSFCAPETQQFLIPILIAERVLDDFWQKLSTWNYIFTRHDQMKTHNPHPRLTEVWYFLKSFLEEIVENVRKSSSD